ACFLTRLGTYVC
nr:Chain A, ALA-CYS-PHE-LEU-THR-ARG-LEU-GLY-THR-TYR-VAL-CYS [Boana raniceps]